MEYFDKLMNKVCGKQFFVVVNVVVVAVNLCLGLVVNLAAFTTLSTSPSPVITTLADPDNLTSVSPGVVPAPYGLTDATGNFTTHAFVWAAKSWQEVTGSAEVCLATHASTERLHWVAIHARTWTGPISIAVFASGKEYAIASSMVAYLRRCVEGVEERVSFHLVHPRTNPPEHAAAPPVMPCGKEEEVNAYMVAAVGLGNNMVAGVGSQTQRYPRYPQNLLRNVAWRACHTRYALNVDVDMLTPPNMYPRLSAFLYGRGRCGRCAWVVPVYEVNSTTPTPPADKGELLGLLIRGKARRFHVKVYEKNQGNSHLEQWEVDAGTHDPHSAPYTVLYNVTSYEEFWEPVLVLPRGAPAFDERFVGYGFTRSSQVYELHIRGFHFGVLDEGYLTHLGFQTTASYPPARYAQIEINRIRYQMFKKELHARLGLPQPPPLSPPSPRLNSAGLRVTLSGRKPRVVVRGVARRFITRRHL